MVGLLSPTYDYFNGENGWQPIEVGLLAFLEQFHQETMDPVHIKGFSVNFDFWKSGRVEIWSINIKLMVVNIPYGNQTCYRRVTFFRHLWISVGFDPFYIVKSCHTPIAAMPRNFCKSFVSPLRHQCPVPKTYSLSYWISSSPLGHFV